jgi:hypothetical protein
MYREMKSETPEWKKEIAEKVKAYGERKKRLITPQGPIKESVDVSGPPGKENSVPVHSKPAEPIREEKPAPVPVERSVPDPKPEPPPAPEPVISPALEIWTEDLHDFPAVDGSIEFISEDMPSSGEPYTGRRLIAGIIDHTILVVLLIVFMGAYSLLTGKTMEEQIATPWSVTIPAFLICHCIYYLYFFSATRQTPGMVFLSLELRSSGSALIPFGKVLARWIVMVVMNVLNFIPVLAGKKFLLMDLISATEMRSFK